MSEERILHFVGSYDQLVEKMKDSETLCVIDFFAQWCGPCQALGRILPSIAQAYPDVTFIKIDIDQNKAIASQLNVRSIPTIVYFAGGEELIRVIGGNPQMIKMKIDEFKEIAKEKLRKAKAPITLKDKDEDGIIRFEDNYKSLMRDIKERKCLAVVYFINEAIDSCADVISNVLQFAVDFENVAFYEVNVDTMRDVRVGFNVLQLPDVRLVKGRETIATIFGNKPDELREAIAKNQ